MRDPKSNQASRPAGMTGMVFVLALAKLLAHLGTASHYPLHRDELYYLVCGRHLAWSYPDHPPLVPWFAAISERLFGVSPFWLRLWPALAGAALVLLAGRLAWRFGGGRLAQVLAALALALSPMFLISNSLMQTVFLDQLLWAVSAAVWVAILGGASQRWYLLIGVLLGLGVLAKLTVFVWGLGVLVGLLLTRDRVQLRSPWLWMGAMIAAACAVPVLHWQVQHGWPVREFISANRADDPVTPWGFLAMQAGMSGPIVGTSLLMGGFFFLLGRGWGGRWRSVGLAVAVAWGVFLVTGGKPYYSGPTYPVLFAGGAVLAERFLLRKDSRAWRTTVVALLVSQMWMVPAFLPVIPEKQLAGWVDRLPHENWQDMFGWEEIAAQAARACDSLSAAEQSGVRVLTDNYGLAGAIDIYGRELGLPAAISGHNGYAFWESDPTLDPVIVVGYDVDWLHKNYEVVRDLGTIDGAELFPSEEKGKSISYCTGLKVPSGELWAALKHFD